MTLAELCVPRAVGSAELARLTAAVASSLTTLGFTVERQEFLASPTRLHAVSAFAAGAGLVSVGSAPLLMSSAPAWVVSLLVAGALSVVGVLSYGVAQGYVGGVALVVPAVNLIATRGEPSVWLVAHLDTKSQRFSLATRIIAAGALGIGLLGVVVAVVARWWSPLSWAVVLPPVAAALWGGGVLSFSAPENASPGAVDDASGVAAVLGAARQLAGTDQVGILLTSAEEWAMLGARAWARERRRGHAFINVDGLDDRGPFRVMPHKGGRALAQAVAQALREQGAPVRVARLPPGVLVDGVVLARAGLEGVTMSRGTWRTLRVVHTPRDRRARLGGESIGLAAAALAAALKRSPRVDERTGRP